MSGNADSLTRDLERKRAAILAAKQALTNGKPVEDPALLPGKGLTLWRPGLDLAPSAVEKRRAKAEELAETGAIWEGYDPDPIPARATDSFFSGPAMPGGVRERLRARRRNG